MLSDLMMNIGWLDRKYLFCACTGIVARADDEKMRGRGDKKTDLFS